MPRTFSESTWISTLVRILAVAPVLVGAGVLALWLLGKPELAVFGEGMVPMAPSTALLFCGFGLALFYAVHRPHHRGIQRAAFWIILLLAMAALAMGTLSALGIRHEVEHLGLARGPEGLGGIPVGHMSPLTAVAFILAALAYLSTPTPYPGRFRSGTSALSFAALLLALSLLMLLAYLFGVPLLVGTSYIPPALLTSGAFLALGLGLALHTLPHLSLLQGRPKAEMQAGLTYLGIFALVAVGALTLSFIHLRHFEAELRTEAQQQLVAITELKVRQLAEFRRERLGDALLLKNAPGISALATRVLENPSDARANSQFQHWLDQLHLQAQYSLLRLVDKQGQVRLSSPVNGPPLEPSSLQSVAQVLRSGQPQLQDFHLSVQDQQPLLALLVPIHAAQNSQRTLGVLALQLEPNAFLYPFLKAWPLASRTAETLLVRREGDDVVFLNELRFQEHAPLKLRFPLAGVELPAAKAALGHKGLVEGKDYRGVQVLAYLHPIPGSPWAMVARIDRSEVLAPLRGRAWQLLGLNLLLLATVAFGLGFLRRSQRLRTLQAASRADAELRASEYRFGHAVQEAPLPMMIHAEDGEVIALSRAWTELSGYSHADIPTINDWTEKAYGIHRQPVIEEINTLYELEQRKAEGEYTVTCRDGSTRIWDFSSVSLGRLPDGRRIAMSMASDVTERKQGEVNLRASEESLRLTLHSIGDAVIATDLAGRITRMNPTAERLTGWPLADATGHPLAEVFRIISALTREPSEDPVQKVLAQGVVVGLANHTVLVARDGQEYQIADSAAPLRDAAGEITGVVMVFSDVTEKYRVEETLTRTNELLKNATEIAKIGAWELELASMQLTWSLGTYRLHELDPQTPVDVASGIHFYAPDAQPVIAAAVQAAIESGTSYDLELPLLTAKGRAFWARAQCHPVTENGRVVKLVGAFQDITERKQVEEELRVREVKFRAVAELSPVAIYASTGSDQKGIFINEAFSKIFGFSLEDVPTVGAWWIKAFSDETYRQQVIDQWTRNIEQANQNNQDVEALECVCSCKDGSGKWIAWVGKTIGEEFWAFGYDLTERRQAEEEKANLQVKLQQFQKMESLGILAGGVAHDMNNVLGAILGLASAHLGTQPTGSPLHRALDTIVKATERGGKTVKSLLSFARQSPVENNRLDMNAILREQVTLLERTTLAKVHLEMDLEAELRPILGDASALTHAFMNLCVNAVDAMPANGTLTLHTRNVDNHWIEVVVEDNGTGMPKEVLERAMEPFFTTKGTGKGTGLGLSMVFSTVKAHQGQIAIESEPGQGTRVMLRFPALDQESPVQPAATAVTEATLMAHGTMKVLLIDDDDLIQSSVQAILEVMGHTVVTTAQSGEEALAMLEAGLEADLVILDMNMPGLGGIGTLPRLRALRPKVPVLLSTGRVDQTALTLVSAHPGVTLLPKPFAMRDLQKHLDQIWLG